MTKEQKFYNALKDIFVGAKVEGESGYINLMRTKSRYYEKGVFPKLHEDVEKALKPFPHFRDELFDKLYTFFHRYFSESGSIYFRYTPLHQNVYEKVYTDDKDVMLFYKTHMLYYVKTDRMFKSLEVEIPPDPPFVKGGEGGIKFFFDVSTLEHKKSNEKREIIYSLKDKRKDGTIVFTVAYSEKGRKTKIDDILKALKKGGVKLKDELLERAFRIFEKQSEVDYFINKNAKAFLEEQFNLWLYQYVFSGESGWTETRIKQLQTLKDVAFKIIAFISQFEDELVKIWNKPKFVLNSNYVITLDKLVNPSPLRGEGKGEGDKFNLIEKILNHKNFKVQVEEWKQLGIINGSFKKTDITEQDLTGKYLNKKYKYLPVDTKYFKDLELEILGLFDNLDDALDGWLIKSENYQALNTILPKFRGKVRCIHIDPPYNTDTSGFMYANKYQHSSWLTMMENRISVSSKLMDKQSSFLCHIDENEYERLHALFQSMNESYLSTVIWDKKNPMMGGAGIALQHEYIIWCSRHQGYFEIKGENIKEILAKAKALIDYYGSVTEECRNEFADWIKNHKQLTGGERAYQYLETDGRVYRHVAMTWPNPNKAPKQFFIPLIHPVTGEPCPVPNRGWSRTPEKMKELIERNEIVFGIDETTQPQRKIYLTADSKRPISSVIYNGKKGKSEIERMGLDFSYCHPVSLYEEIVNGALLTPTGYVLDFFAGSGTTGHAVINLNREDGGKRKYILVEMGDYFNTVLMPRIKKVVFSDKWMEGKAQEGKGISHFMKYYSLEQYEDTLRRVKYDDSDLFDDPNQDPYNQYVFLRDLKMLDALKVDLKKNKVTVDLSKLYDGIDIAETLSNLKGKWIKRITTESVEFADGETVELKNLDYKLIKPLIWW